MNIKSCDSFVGRFTDAQLDEIARSGEPLYHNNGFCLNPDPGPISPDYEIVVVGTDGCGNRGETFLRGITPRGKNLVWQGKVKRLVADGCNENMAKVATGVRYGMEEGVWKLAEELIPIIKVGVELRGVQSHEAFHVKTGMDHPASFPRILSAIEIAYRVIGSRRKTAAA